MKKILLALTLTTAIAQAQYIEVPPYLDFSSLTQEIKGDAPQQDDIPGGSEGYLYNLGTGGVDRVSVPPVLKINQGYRASMSAGLGYSCGRFNPFSNVEAIMNDAVNKFKKMPQQFVTAGQQAVAAMPAYLLNKINPTLYNTLTKNLDDAFDLFELEFKSCQQWESEITNEAGTYYDYFKAASNDAMQKSIATNTSSTIDEVRQQASEKGADDGVVGAGGERKGGVGQEPFSASNEVILAGYNILLNREETDTSAIAGNLNNEPLARLFKKPSDLQDWTNKIYGNREWSLPEGDSRTKTTAGVGFKYQYNTHRFHFSELYSKLINAEITVDQFKELTGGVQMSTAELLDLRTLTGYGKDITIQILSQREAVRDMRLRLEMLIKVLEAGLEDPALAQSTSAAVLKNDILSLIAKITDDLHKNSILTEEG